MIKTIFTTLIGISFLLIVGTIGYGIAYLFRDYEFNERNLGIIVVGGSILIVSHIIGRFILEVKNEKVEGITSSNNE